MTDCPSCGDEFPRIGRHWSSSDCGYPPIDSDQRDVLDGLMLAGASLTGNAEYPAVSKGTTSTELAEWTAGRLGWLCGSVRETEGEDNREVVYRFRTPAHEGLLRYERWREIDGSGGYWPPESYRLTAPVARVWYAFAGGLQWSGPYDSQRQAHFSALHDDRAAVIAKLLESAGYEPARVGKRVQLSTIDTDRWLDWIGDPVSGVEYKWTGSVIGYRVHRHAPESEPDFRAAFAREALHIARQRTDKELTPGTFDGLIEPIDADEVAETLGGGSWDNALHVSGVDQAERGHYTQGDLESDIAALEEVDARVDGFLSRRRYDAERDDEHPAGDSIADRRGWNETKEAAGLPIQRTPTTVSREEMANAVQTVETRVEGMLTGSMYEELRDEEHPSLSAIIKGPGWAGIKFEAGLEVEPRGGGLSNE